MSNASGKIADALKSSTLFANVFGVKPEDEVKLVEKPAPSEPEADGTVKIPITESEKPKRQKVKVTIGDDGVPAAGEPQAVEPEKQAAEAEIKDEPAKEEAADGAAKVEAKADDKPKKPARGSVPDPAALLAEDDAEVEVAAVATGVAASAEEIGAATARAVADALKPKREEPKQTFDELPPEYDVDQYRQLAKLYPDLYNEKALVRDLTEWKSKKDKYIQEWEAKHPDEEFDEEDRQHDAFFAKHEPKIEETHLKKAERAALLAAAKEEVLKEVAPEVDRLKADAERRARLAEVVPLSVQDGHEVVASVVSKLFPGVEFKEAVAKLEAEQPLTASVVEQVAVPLAQAAQAARLLMEDAVPLDKANAAHQNAVALMRNAEDAILAAPPAKQVFGGKRYAPYAEYAKLSKKERAGRWTLTADYMAKYAALEAQKAFDAAHESVATLAKKQFGANGHATTVTQNTPSAKSAPAAAAKPKVATQSLPERGGISVEGGKPKPDKIDPVGRLLQRIGVV